MTIASRLEALAEDHDRHALRANFKGNAKYAANPQIADKRAYHIGAAADLRAAALAVADLRPALSRAPTPIVLVEIDRNSRLSVLGTGEVQVALVDRRVDQFGVTLLPRENQIEQILAAIGDLYVISRSHDMAGTAYEAIRRLTAGDTVVAQFKSEKEVSDGA